LIIGQHINELKNHTGISVPESGNTFCGGGSKNEWLEGGGEFAVSKTTPVNLIFWLKGNR
jgi:hypothetical protein